MRKKIIPCLALLALALVVAAVIALVRASSAGPLRVGMTGGEVDDALGKTNYRDFCRNHKGEGLRLDAMSYNITPDRRGNTVMLYVYFDNDDQDGPEVQRVVRWDTQTSANSWQYQFKYLLGLNQSGWPKEPTSPPGSGPARPKSSAATYTGDGSARR